MTKWPCHARGHETCNVIFFKNNVDHVVISQCWCGASKAQLLLYWHQSSNGGWVEVCTAKGNCVPAFWKNVFNSNGWSCVGGIWRWLIDWQEKAHLGLKGYLSQTERGWGTASDGQPTVLKGRSCESSREGAWSTPGLHPWTPGEGIGNTTWNLYFVGCLS